MHNFNIDAACLGYVPRGFMTSATSAAQFETTSS